MTQTKFFYWRDLSPFARSHLRSSVLVAGVSRPSKILPFTGSVGCAPSGSHSPPRGRQCPCPFPPAALPVPVSLHLTCKHQDGEVRRQTSTKALPPSRDRCRKVTNLSFLPSCRVEPRGPNSFTVRVLPPRPTPAPAARRRQRVVEGQVKKLLLLMQKSQNEFRDSFEWTFWSFGTRRERRAKGRRVPHRWALGGRRWTSDPPDRGGGAKQGRVSTRLGGVPRSRGPTVSPEAGKYLPRRRAERLAYASARVGAEAVRPRVQEGPRARGHAHARTRTSRGDGDGDGDGHGVGAGDGGGGGGGPQRSDSSRSRRRVVAALSPSPRRLGRPPARPPACPSTRATPSPPA